MNIIASDSTIENPLEGTTFISWATDSGVDQLLPYLWKPTDNFYINISEAKLPIETKGFFHSFPLLMNTENIVDLSIHEISDSMRVSTTEVEKHLKVLKNLQCFLLEIKEGSYFICPLWCFYGDDEAHLFDLIHRWNQKLKTSFQ